MTGIHGLQHVQRGLIANLAHDDPVWTHAQRIDHQVADGDFAATFNVGWAGFERDHMLLPELQFGGILDGQDAFIRRDKAGKDVQERGLA